MSHYSVAVFSRKGQDIEELLAPYDENMKVEPYVWKSREEAVAYARENFKTEGKTDDECWRMAAEDSETDEDGNIYSTYNPRSAWDWWTVGGRWGGMLRVNGKPADSGRVGDMDFPVDRGAYEAALRFWDVVVDHKPAGPGEVPFSLYSEEYYREYYGDRETYARQMASFSTYAVITPDGEWHAPGRMGWFGCSSESADESRDWYGHYKERFLDAADPDWILTIIDCHI